MGELLRLPLENTRSLPEESSKSSRDGKKEKEESMAEVIELFPKAMESAFLKELEGIEKNPNAQSWREQVKDIPKTSKIFLAGEAAISSISAFFSGGMALKVIESLSQNRKLDVAMYGFISLVAGLASLGSFVRARRYGTVKDVSKLSWAENEAQ